jgi:hypothetical protein
MRAREKPGNPSLRKILSTVDLLELTNSDHLLLIMQAVLSYNFNEVKRTQPSPSVSVPWKNTLAYFCSIGEEKVSFLTLARGQH